MPVNELILDDTRKTQLDGNIKSMIESGADNDAVMEYASEFKTKFGQPSKKNESSKPLPNFGSELPFGKTPLVAPAPSIKNTSQSRLPSTSIPTIESAVKGASTNLTPEQMDVPVAAVPAIKAERQAEKDTELKKQMVYNDMRYARISDKQQAQERGYNNIQDYYKDRESFLINNYLSDDDKEEARAQNAFTGAKQSGNEKLASEEMQNLLNAKSKFRAKINEQRGEIDNEESTLKQSVESGMPPEQFGAAKKVLDHKRATLDLMSKPYYDPKSAMNKVLSDNITEVSAVAKPSQTPKEKLEEYTNALYTQLNMMREDLGWDADNGALDAYAKDFQLRRDGKGDLVDKMYETELKLRNAVKVLELNRTPIDNETGLGVFGKSFATSLNPASASKQNTEQIVAQNLQSINEDAGISEAVDSEQKKFAEENAKDYKPYSTKWFASPAGASAAIMLEFIPASMATEGAFAATKIGRLVNLAEQYGKVKGLNTTQKYVNAIQKYKTLKAADTIGKFALKTQANGLKFGTTSEIVAQLFPKDADQVNFTTGYFGGQIGKGSEQLLGGAATSLAKVFGSKAPEAAKAIERLGEQFKFAKDAPKVIMGEIGEEFGESLGQIYKESDSWKEMSAKLDEQFGTLDKATQFVIQTGIMALGMGGGTAVGANLMKSSKAAYNKLNREQRAVVDEVLDSVSDEENRVANDVTTEVADEIKDKEPKAENEVNNITNDQITKRLSEIDGLISSDNSSMAEKGSGNLIKEAREELLQERDSLREKANLNNTRKTPEAKPVSFENPSLSSGVNTGLFVNSKGATINERNVGSYTKLGYTKEQIDNFSSDEAQQIISQKIENPNVENTATVTQPTGEQINEPITKTETPENTQTEQPVTESNVGNVNTDTTTENIPLKDQLVKAGKIVLDKKGNVEDVRQNSGESSHFFQDLTSIAKDKNTTENEAKKEALDYYLKVKDDKGEFKTKFADWENKIMAKYGRSGREYRIRRPDKNDMEGHENDYSWSTEKNGMPVIMFNDKLLGRDIPWKEQKQGYIDRYIEPELKAYEESGNKEAVDKMRQYKELFEKYIKSNRDLKLHMIHNEMYGIMNAGKEISVEDIDNNYINSLKEVKRLQNIPVGKDYYGEPVIFTTAGPEGIEKFRKPGSEGYKKNDDLTGQEGIYFSRDIRNQDKYAGFEKGKPAEGKDLYYTFLKYKNPYHINDPQAQAKYPLTDIKTITTEQRKALEDLGYDAVILGSPERPKEEVVVFEPEQVDIIGTYRKGFLDKVESPVSESIHPSPVPKRYTEAGGNKLVDKNGNPLVLYRGYDTTPFQKMKGREGLWFTTDKNRAEGFGSKVSSFIARSENPSLEHFADIAFLTKEQYKIAEDAGIDALISERPNEQFDVLMLNDENVIETTQPQSENKSKSDRKKLSDAKIDEVAEALKKWLPKADGGEKSGIGQDEIIDLIASAVKTLVNTGIDIHEAIKTVRAKLDEAFDTSDVKDDNIVKAVNKLEPPNETGIKHEKTAELREEMGLPEYLKTGKKNEELEAEADNLLKNKVNVDKLLTRLENGDLPTDVEQVLLRNYIAGIADKVAKNPTDDLILEAKRAIDAADRIGGTEVARSLAARRNLQPRDETLLNYFVQDIDANDGAMLTEGQKKIAQKEFEEITAAKQALEEKIAQLEAENDKLKATRKTKEYKPSPVKRSHEDYVAERKKIADDIKSKLKALKADSTAVIIPYARELATISSDVAKMVKSYVSEGVTNLEEIVKNIHADLKDSIEGITEKDVMSVIAGNYNDKKYTRNEIAKQVFELKQQAKLLAKIEALENGEQPTIERKKIERNKELERLRKQIKGFDATKLAEFKSRVERNITKLETDLASGNIKTTDVNIPIKLDTEATKLKDKYLKLKRERDLRIEQEKYANRSKYEKIKDQAIDVLNVPRTIMSSMDFSAPLRQAAVATISHPIISAGAFKEMFKQAFSQKRFDRWFHDVKSDPRFGVAEDAGLFIADPHDVRMVAKEEAFMNNLAEKIPFIGGAIKGSERAYVLYLNKMRWDLFNSMVETFERQGQDIYNSPKLYKDAASFINNATGRGSFSGAAKGLETAAPILNSLLFSPRLVASRLNFINPLYYKKLSPQVRKSALKDVAIYTSTVLGILGLMVAAWGCEDDCKECDDCIKVELDPRSTDFGKVRIGNVRWDLWAGYQQYVRVFTQLLTGQTKSASTGEISDLTGQGAFGRTRGDVALAFVRGKLAPVPSMAADVLSGRTVTGEPVTILEEAKGHLAPLIFSDVAAVMKEQGMKGILTGGIPATFGIGVSAYKNKHDKYVVDGEENIMSVNARNINDAANELKKAENIKEKEEKEANLAEDDIANKVTNEEKKLREVINKAKADKIGIVITEIEKLPAKDREETLNRWEAIGIISEETLSMLDVKNNGEVVLNEDYFK